MNEVDLILEDTFFEIHTVDDKDSYSGRMQIKLGLDRPNDQ